VKEDGQVVAFCRERVIGFELLTTCRGKWVAWWQVVIPEMS